MYGIIYFTMNLVNGKTYIGQTVRYKKVPDDAFGTSTYYGSGKLLKKALKKYGQINFVRHTIEECESLGELDNREKYWIKELTPDYNIAKGGCGPGVMGEMSEETKKKISEANMGRQISLETREKIRNTLKGRPLPEETKRKLRGRKCSEETIQKRIKTRTGMPTAKKGQKQTAETKKKISDALKGHHVSEETKQKMSMANKGQKRSEETKQKMSHAQNRRFITEKN